MILMFIRNCVDWFQETTRRGLFKLKTIVSTIVIIIFVFVILLWISVFMYGSFYYSYMPSESHIMPVHLTFKTCDIGVGPCSFPSANLSLLKPGQESMFVTGQQYSIVMNVDLPESDANKHVGMFIVKLQLYNKNGETLTMASRSTMLRYRSELLRVLDTFVFSPLLLSGFVDQQQTLNIEFFTNYIDDPYNEAFGMVIEIQNLHVQLYSMVLKIILSMDETGKSHMAENKNFLVLKYNQAVGMVIEVQNLHVQLYSMVLKMYAKFTGLRYFLYHWPVTSAMIGISFNFLLLMFIALLSWYQCLPSSKSNGGDFNTYSNHGYESIEERRKRIKKMMDQEKEDRQSSTKCKVETAETVGYEATEEIIPEKDNSSDTESLLRHRHFKPGIESSS